MDLSGPWKAVVNGKGAIFWSLTIIDVFTGWPEIIPIYTKGAGTIRDLIEHKWLRRYPRPSRVILILVASLTTNSFELRSLSGLSSQSLLR